LRDLRGPTSNGRNEPDKRGREREGRGRKEKNRGGRKGVVPHLFNATSTTVADWDTVK